MVDEKLLRRLNLDYQDYLTYLNINLTIAVSLFIAVFSYILISLQSLNENILILLFLILTFLEIIFISIHFWLYQKKERIKYLIVNS